MLLLLVISKIALVTIAISFSVISVGQIDMVPTTHSPSATRLGQSKQLKYLFLNNYSYSFNYIHFIYIYLQRAGFRFPKSQFRI